MSKVIICRGLPGSGKSTWAREQVEKNPDTWKRINMDDLRMMLNNKLVIGKDAEKFMKKMRDVLIMETLKEKKNIISDNTSLSPKSVEHIKQLVHKFNKDNNENVEVEIKFFDTPLQECIKRDLKRPNSVGQKVIMDMYNQFLAPKVELIVQSPLLPRMIICDIDGTVSEMTDRGPFDWKRVGEDKPKKNVLNIIKCLHNSGYLIQFMSGRDEICRKETNDWLIQHLGFLDFHILMRPEGDNRKDSVIKKELFDNHIRGKYYIEAVFDDRDQVVSLWRNEIGLTCLQCDYGDF